MGILLHFILNKFSKRKTYSHCQVNVSELYKHVTTRQCGLNRLDDTMTDPHDIKIEFKCHDKYAHKEMAFECKSINEADQTVEQF